MTGHVRRWDTEVRETVSSPVHGEGMSEYTKAKLYAGFAAYPVQRQGQLPLYFSLT
jgi:hypothetical protein